MRCFLQTRKSKVATLWLELDAEFSNPNSCGEVLHRRQAGPERTGSRRERMGSQVAPRRLMLSALGLVMKNL